VSCALKEVSMDEHSNVLASLLEGILFRLVYGDVTLRNLIKSTKKMYIKSSFETNLEDAKYMTQTSFLILSKWENLINVIALLFDVDLKNASLKNFLDVKNMREMASLFYVKKSISLFQNTARVLLRATVAATSSGQQKGWIFTKIAVVYWACFFFRSLTWNRVILGLILTLTKRAFLAEKGSQFKSISDLLTSYISFFTTDHLRSFSLLFQSVNKEMDGSQNPNFEQKLNSTMETGTKLSYNLLSKLLWILQFEWTKQYALLTGYIMPAATAFLINFWSNALAIIMPVTMAVLGDQKTLRFLSKL